MRDWPTFGHIMAFLFRFQKERGFLPTRDEALQELEWNWPREKV